MNTHTPLLPALASRASIDALVNRVHHCKAEMLLDRLPDDCIDLIVTSPPYDNLRTYKGFEWDFEHIAQGSYRVLKPGGVLVWVVGDATVNGSETLTSMRQAIYFKDCVGFRMHDTMIWHKKPGLPGKFNRYVPAFEYMFVFSKGSPTTVNLVTERNPNAGKIKDKWRTDKDGWKRVKQKHITKDERVLDNVWIINVGAWHTSSDNTVHPAMFPEALAERHILTWSNPGDIVLDYFGGSGTTAKMARNNNRHWITCDLSAEYCDLMRRRLAMPFTPNMFDTLLAASE